jgi:hypothetical protein
MSLSTEAERSNSRSRFANTASHRKRHYERVEESMKLRSHVIEIAAAVTLVAFAGTSALAQGSTTTGKAGSATTTQSTTGKTGAGSTTSQSTPSTTNGKAGQTTGAVGSQSTAKSAGAATSSGPWTADNVTAARPFGNINVTAAGSSTESMRTWAQGRSASERAELSGRCAVITSTTNASKYPADAMQFCRNYMMVAAASPAGKAGTTTR